MILQINTQHAMLKLDDTGTVDTIEVITGHKGTNGLTHGATGTLGNLNLVLLTPDMKS